jgi:hypothetical protein
MFDNVMEKSSGPQIIDPSSASEASDKEDSPVKPATKRKLGPKPTKRKIESSGSETTPGKKKVKKYILAFGVSQFNSEIISILQPQQKKKKKSESSDESDNYVDDSDSDFDG